MYNREDVLNTCITVFKCTPTMYMYMYIHDILPVRLQCNGVCFPQVEEEEEVLAVPTTTTD